MVHAKRSKDVTCVNSNGCGNRPLPAIQTSSLFAETFNDELRKCMECQTHSVEILEGILQLGGQISQRSQYPFNCDSLDILSQILKFEFSQRYRFKIYSRRMGISDEIDSREGLLRPGTASGSVPHQVLPPWFDYASRFIHLSVFGIFGVLTRYLLQHFFGPGRTLLYLDLPSNILGSFLMGWLGIIYKESISEISELLAVGLTTGYLGSLTTFSAWNQTVLDLSVSGHWIHATLGVILGLAFTATSIWLGVLTANASKNHFPMKISLKVDNSFKKVVVFVGLVLLLVGLWGLSIALLVEPQNGEKLWVACIVGPFGVCIRWYLSQFNGEGLGKNNAMKWIPFGTLAANILAATLMAALSTVKKVVHTQECDLYVNGVQFGFLGCLSTVSTFMAEFYKLHTSKNPWRAYAYAGITLLPSLIFGTLIYSVPVWAKA